MERIYINPGHSNKDPGAVGYETERKLNVKVSEYQKEHLLKNYVCEVRMNPGTMNSTREVAEDANKWKATFLCSNHFNAGKGDGWEGLVHNENRVDIGKVFEKHVKAAGQNSRGVKLRPELNVLRLTNMPAILNEGAFVDNKKDIQDWNDDAELKKLGIAYAEATAEVRNLPKKAVPAPAPAPSPTPAPSSGMYRVFDKDEKQVGAFSKEANAFNEVKKQLQSGGAARITLSEK